MKTLAMVFDIYGCDKGTKRHRYDRVYEPALKDFLNVPFDMLEIGIFKGASTSAWINYFQQVNIVGIDIFKRIKMKDIEVLQHPRVKACRCNSVKGPTDEFVKLAGKGFDVIIDDGLHTHEAQWKTFQNFIPFLKQGGVYFIEDVWPFDKMTPQEKKHHWLKKHSPAFSEHNYQCLREVISPYKVIEHDLRKGFHPDTFILEIEK